MKLKKFITGFFVSLVLIFNSFAQPEQPSQMQDDTKIDSLRSDFGERFKQSEDKTNFKKLRDYRGEKENLILSYSARFKSLQSDIKALEEDVANIQNSTTRLKQRFDNSSDSAFSIAGFFNFQSAQKHLLSVGLSVDDTRLNRKAMTEVVFPKINELISNLNAKLKSMNDRINTISYNINNAQTDLNLCLSTIDEALAPEYKELQLKIGLGYTVLLTLGLIILLLIVGIMTNKISLDTIKTLMSDGGLQFVTIFILMIAIILFGILNILEGKELAAILAGISGYILGRGSKSKEEKACEKQAKINDSETKEIKDIQKT